MNWHNRFKTMKKALGLNNQDIADITELNYNSIKNQTQPNKDLPKWLKLTIVIFERLSGSPFKNFIAGNGLYMKSAENKTEIN